MDSGKLWCLGEREVTPCELFVCGTQIMTALGTSAYVVFGQISQAGEMDAEYFGRLNSGHALRSNKFATSNSPVNARRKIGEFLLGFPEDFWGSIEVTPRRFPEGSKLQSCGWMGGVRVGPYLVAVSALAEEHDRLVAASLAWAWTHRLQCNPAAMFENLGGGLVTPVFEVETEDPNGFIRFVAEVMGDSGITASASGGRRGVFVATKDIRDLGPTIGVVVREG